MSVIVIGGASGAKLVLNFLISSGIGCFLFDTFLKEEKYDKYILDIIGTDIKSILKENDYFIATGNNKLRRERTEYFRLIAESTPINVIHSTACISTTVSIGYGNFICPNAVINVDAIIGNGTIINTGAIVEHDCIVDDYAQIGPGAVLTGKVMVGEEAFIGANAVIIPGIVIGKGAVVAAGATVIEDVKENTLVAGCPAVFKKEVPR